jgi:nitrite reductase/ring-hydroxylating ferredoxin subunit
MHASGMLAQQRHALEATIITCPCHGSKFDITTGKVVTWAGKHPILGGLTSFMKKGCARV